ncbi:MAG: AAA family ATPase [Planctomycetota bacterium]
MRIETLHIDNFGVFRDMRLTRLPPGLVLIQGDNEAGKSTLLWFLRGLLFGFPDGRSRDPRYVLADGATHGGRLEVVADNGDEYTISRRGVRVGGELVISDSDSVNCGE